MTLPILIKSKLFSISYDVRYKNQSKKCEIESSSTESSNVINTSNGFRRGMSCKTLLMDATYDWTNILCNGKGQIDVLLLDFNKAFDVVPHHCLLTNRLLLMGQNLNVEWLNQVCLKGHSIRSTPLPHLY